MNMCRAELTTSFMETGAFKASAISCAFALTLPFLLRIVLMASLRLFWRPCRVMPFACPFAHR